MRAGRFGALVESHILPGRELPGPNSLGNLWTTFEALFGAALGGVISAGRSHF